MGAVDEGLDLSLGKGMGGQTRGSPPCLSPPISVACMSFLPHFLARTFSLVPPSPIDFACLLPSKLARSLLSLLSLE